MNEPNSRGIFARLYGCFDSGLRKAMRTTLWLLKFMIPVSLAVALLKWSGALNTVGDWMAPLFRVVGLPGETAVAFLTGALLNVYSAIAAMLPMGLTAREITILGLMVLICHNLPIEVTVQHKAGSSGLRILLLRVLGALAAGAALHLLLPAEAADAVRTVAAVAPVRGELGDALLGWAVGSGWLIAKVALFVSGVMVLQAVLNEFGIMPWLARFLAWPLAVLGLPKRTVFLWIVANTIGLAYGAAVILEETRTGQLTRDETEMINRSVAVCHSLLEDTLLFVAIGAWALWITLPRVALAALVVWAYRLTRAATVR